LRLFDNHYKHIACHARPQEHQCHEQQAACHFTKVFRVFTRFMDAVISGWRDEQHGCDGCGQQADEMNYLPGPPQLFKALRKDNGKLKSQKSLRAGPPGCS
jgi:hypothetical protein